MALAGRFMMKWEKVRGRWIFICRCFFRLRVLVGEDDSELGDEGGELTGVVGAEYVAE